MEEQLEQFKSVDAVIAEATSKKNGNGHKSTDVTLPSALESQPATSPTKKGQKKSGGITIPRVFSHEGVHPFETITWSKREAVISNEKGEVVFAQKDVEVPAFWSDMATNVVVSKYFRGSINTPQREKSVRQLISRVADTIADWGLKDGYFVNQSQRDAFNHELTTILVEQWASFNSPVWFNCGVEPHPQCSACFILAVEDTMNSLLELQSAEGMIFKYGSGAGSNLSKIRSSKELLSGGGQPSGPVSFMKGYDAWAGTIKSGGKTRRAAKMQILDCDHPDIREFVNAKRLEEEKAWALIEQGYNGGFNVPGGAYDSVFFQNSNCSVRLSDEFMNALINGEKFATRKRTDKSVVEWIDPRELMKEISYGTWVCGDPGVQFDSTINEWHTSANTGRINGSNPCSEYMHLDDSACNLASINLLKYLAEDGQSFDVERFKHTVDVMLLAQDIIVDNASYPTEKIGKNARAFRELGLGFANLGALLMNLGLPYDSDEGRNLAGSIMALLCGESYKMSALIAKEQGPHTGYKVNEAPMLRVIAKHTKAADALPHSKFLITETLRTEAQKAWHSALELGTKHGIRNSQTTVLAPTGTIAFMMDCDTTGIEPDIALVKYKKLVGGGLLKIVNQSVPNALKVLGYSESECAAIVDYIDKNDTIEGAPQLKEEHLPVFDCAFKPMNGTRSIHYRGHIKMMAACQPFVSGAISKTVNMPEHATVEEIYDTYIDAWKMGLKAIAVYRDNSKRSQPLATSNEKTKLTESAMALATGEATRKRLPDERQSITHKFNIAGHEGYITVGLYEDGSPGEIFITMAKEGSTLSGVMDAFATAVSVGLQYGVPLSALVKKFSHMRFEPSGFTPNPQIPFAKSVLDYIFRWLGSKFLDADDQKAIGIHAVDGASYGPESKSNAELSDAPAPESDRPKAIGFKVATVNSSLRSPSAGTSSTVGKPTGKLSTKASAQSLVAFELSEDAPPCHNCGSSLMVRQGACYRCLVCGSQGGCG